ncbi:hypothetical protein BpHYR1_049096 [Brachionus plicatilis]|uniref:Uncharacterized protein n=1 Tax=Brachionus plicatilis TaxID=10195 RepID=A0A3M7R749_BRAPC|nr:hypothetical protein BpHYR1_049096 [Brachionus plicatilis]
MMKNALNEFIEITHLVKEKDLPLKKTLPHNHNSFKALDKTVSNNSLDHYIDDFRVAGSLINKIIPNY